LYKFRAIYKQKSSGRSISVVISSCLVGTSVDKNV